jgi:signal peptidase I
VSPEPVEHAHTSGWPESLQWLMGIVVIAIFIVTFIVQAFQIPSESMENTLLTGDYLLVDKLHFGVDDFFGRALPYSKVKRGDIVVFHYPLDPRLHFVKRVIGVPGDHVRLINRQVYINGAPLTEGYVHYFRPHDAFRDEFPRLDFLPAGLSGAWWQEMKKMVEDNQLIVPEGNYFVMGDNRDDSSDSRYWGFVPQQNIVGRPLVIYWSMRKQEDADDATNDKLTRFIYAMGHLMQITRWDRTLRLVN